jgi:hypothetical protein
VGTPVVCFEGVGIASLLKDCPACVVPYLDVGEFASSVESLLRDSARRHSLAEALQLKAHDYSIEKLGPFYAELLQNALDARANGKDRTREFQVGRSTGRRASVQSIGFSSRARPAPFAVRLCRHKRVE